MDALIVVPIADDANVMSSKWSVQTGLRTVEASENS